jgi:replication factor C subunit 2/4
MSKRVLELNASDDRTIDVVRTKIKSFARGIAGGSTVEGKKLPPFKIIILDEADSMTAGAQAALRRTMETYSTVTRFCLVCNYISRIADPLTSRCAKFRFLPLSNDSIHARLRFIAQKEQFTINDEICTALTNTSGGDMRKAITYLQNAVHLYGADLLTADKIYDVAGVVPPQALASFWEAVKAKRFEAMQAAVQDLICNGFAADVLLGQVFQDTVGNSYITKADDVRRALIAQLCSKIDNDLRQGCDEELQLLRLGSFIIEILSHKALSHDFILDQ